MARQTLEAWIQEALTDDQKENACTAISLMHLKGMSETEVFTIRIGAKNWTAKDMSQTFRHKADGYSQDLPGSQTFILQAFYGKEEPEARHPFRINVAGHDVDTLGTEGPTKMGMVQQAMRHSENLHQMLITQTGKLLEAQRHAMQSIVDQNAALMQENADSFALVKGFLADKLNAEHNGEMKRLEYSRHTQERQQLFKTLPMLLNTLTGREIIPTSTHDTELLEFLTESMTEEQLQKLATILTPEQLAFLAPRMQAILESKRVAQELAHSAVGNLNPEDDAAGG